MPGAAPAATGKVRHAQRAQTNNQTYRLCFSDKVRWYYYRLPDAADRRSAEVDTDASAEWGKQRCHSRGGAAPAPRCRRSEAELARRTARLTGRQSRDEIGGGAVADDHCSAAMMHDCSFRADPQKSDLVMDAGFGSGASTVAEHDHSRLHKTPRGFRPARCRMTAARPSTPTLPDRRSPRHQPIGQPLRLGSARDRRSDPAAVANNPRPAARSRPPPRRALPPKESVPLRSGRPEGLHDGRSVSRPRFAP